MRNVTHKKQAMTNLKAHVKLMGLVCLKDVPAKDKQMIQYEPKLHASVRPAAPADRVIPVPVIFPRVPAKMLSTFRSSMLCG